MWQMLAILCVHLYIKRVYFYSFGTKEYSVAQNHVVRAFLLSVRFECCVCTYRLTFLNINLSHYVAFSVRLSPFATVLYVLEQALKVMNKKIGSTKDKLFTKRNNSQTLACTYTHTKWNQTMIATNITARATATATATLTTKQT